MNTFIIIFVSTIVYAFLGISFTYYLIRDKNIQLFNSNKWSYHKLLLYIGMFFFIPFYASMSTRKNY